MTPLDHLGHLIQRAVGRGHPDDCGLKPRLQVGIGAFGGGAGANDLIVGLAAIDDVEQETARRHQRPAQHQREGAGQYHLTACRQNIAMHLAPAFTQVEAAFWKQAIDQGAPDSPRVF